MSMILRSSTVEQSAVNRFVVGSNPTGGAFFLCSSISFYPKLCFLLFQNNSLIPLIK